MALDPNWFYSTPAQSTAAMVGLAGGFLAQRVLAQRGDLSGERAAIRSELEALERVVNSYRAPLPGIVQSMIDSLPVVEQAKQDARSQVTLQRGLRATFSHPRGFASNGEEPSSTETAEKYPTDTRDAAAALSESFQAT